MVARKSRGESKTPVSRSRWMRRPLTWRTVPRPLKTIPLTLAICPACRSRFSDWRTRPVRSSVPYITWWWWWFPHNCPGWWHSCRPGSHIPCLSFLLRQIHHSYEVQELRLVDDLGYGWEQCCYRVIRDIWIVCWALMFHWNLVQWWMVMLEGQSWQWNIVGNLYWVVLWRANNPCWASTWCWCLPGRLIHAWWAGVLRCAGSARPLDMCYLRLPCRVGCLCWVGSLWQLQAGHLCWVGSLCRVGNLCRAVRPWRHVSCRDCICRLLRHLHSTFFIPTIAGWLGMVCSRCPVPGHRWRCRKLRWTTSTTHVTCLLCPSRITRQITTAGGLAPWKGWGCRLSYRTACPVLSRPPRWPLLSRWITMMRSGRSCRAGHWTPLPASVTGLSRSWCWTAMITAGTTGRATPFGRVSGRTMVTGITVSAPIFISGTVVMRIRPRLRPGLAIGLWRSDHFRLHSAGTIARGWLVRLGLGLGLVRSLLVRLTTLLFLRSQNLLMCMELDAVVHGILQLFGSRGGFPLQHLRLCLLLSIPVFWQPCFAHSAWRLSGAFMPALAEATLLTTLVVIASSLKCEHLGNLVRLLAKMNADHVSSSSCNTNRLRHQSRNKPRFLTKFSD